MVDAVTKKWEFLIVPRESRLLSFAFVELIIPFLFILEMEEIERNYVYTQGNKYVMVTGVYTSHIGFNSIVA